jgi:flavin reductase (DIM6/NTAB) family NADH-FMN oxidoreductase RutF/DNA-binding GntR family transcriptional regulator
MSTTGLAARDDLRRLTSAEFRDVIGHFASGVTVITALHDDTPHGTTASAVSSLSLEPPMLLVCLNRTSATGRAVTGAGRFAVNILAEEQADEAMRFATKGDDKFRGLALTPGAHGEPLLGDALATLECRVVEEVAGGTHSVYLAEVDLASARTGAPLAYFRGQFGRLELAQDDAAFEDLRARVLTRRLEVGRPLTLDDLAQRVGLPRGPVYHALGKLASEGLVTRDPDGTFVVMPLTLEALEEGMQARCAIELGAAAMTFAQADAARLADVERCLHATRPECFDGDEGFDLDAYLAAYLAFHESVVALAGAPTLVDAYRRVNAPALIVSLTRARLAEVGADRASAETAFGHHCELLEAYRAGELAAVSRAIVVHSRFALDVARRHMAAAGGEL